MSYSEEIRDKIEFLEQYAEYIGKQVEENRMFIARQLELLEKLVDKLT